MHDSLMRLIHTKRCECITLVEPPLLHTHMHVIKIRSISWKGVLVNAQLLMLNHIYRFLEQSGSCGILALLNKNNWLCS